MAGRSTKRDGVANQVEFHVLTHYEPVWRLLSRPRLRSHVNRVLVNSAANKVPARPHPFSTLAPYTSWSSLTDRSFDSRHLPPQPIEHLPPVDEVADLFLRRGEDTLCAKSTVTFAYFAQWFTDGFLRSDRSVERDPRRNDATHEIDVLPVYGVRPSWTEQLRAHEGGRMKSQIIDGAEFPPFLYENGEKKAEFSEIQVVRPEQIPPERVDDLFAAGSDTTNSQIGFSLMGTLFLREHNRIAGALAHEYPIWDDERLFQTARNILIVVLIKLVIEEYINHIAPYHFKLVADPKPFRNERWYRTNWMAIEFNLLYRWHGLIPTRLDVAGTPRPIWDTIFNPKLVVEHGLARLFDDASRQRAGRVGLLNTAPALREVELASIHQGRAVHLAPYNDYRELSGFPRVTAFEQISGDPEIQAGLRSLYGHVDRIELYPGLFAEDIRPNSVLPSLIGRLVAVDAFSQALTNPLLAPRVFNESTFSPLGIEIIRTTSSLSDVLHRNVPESPGRHLVTMTRSDWQRE